MLSDAWLCVPTMRGVVRVNNETYVEFLKRIDGEQGGHLLGLCGIANNVIRAYESGNEETLSAAMDRLKDQVKRSEQLLVKIRYESEDWEMRHGVGLKDTRKRSGEDE